MDRVHDGLLFDRLQFNPTYARTLIEQAQVYEVSNVSEYFFAVASDEYWPASRFPCCTPPAPVTWVESRRPSVINSVVHGKQRWVGPEQWGLLFVTTDLRLFFKDRPKPWLWAEQNGMVLSVPDEARWLVVSTGYFDYGGGRVGPGGVGRTILDEEGRILKFVAKTGPEGTPAYALSRGKNDGTWEVSGEPHEWYYTATREVSLYAARTGASEMETIKALSQELRRLTEPIWLALSLLHCSNTVVDEGTHPRPVRRRAQREKQALCSFKVLRVEPHTRVVAGDRLASGTTEVGHTALHIRRGGFRDYREGKGLFGKIHKLVWYEPMAVGNVKAGVVSKRYEVSP